MDAANTMPAMTLAFIFGHVADGDIGFNLLDIRFFVTHIEPSFPLVSVWIYKGETSPWLLFNPNYLKLLLSESLLYNVHISPWHFCKNADQYILNFREQIASLLGRYHKNHMLHILGTCMLEKLSSLDRC